MCRIQRGRALRGTLNIQCFCSPLRPLGHAAPLGCSQQLFLQEVPMPAKPLEKAGKNPEGTRTGGDRSCASETPKMLPVCCYPMAERRAEIHCGPAERPQRMGKHSPGIPVAFCLHPDTTACFFSSLRWKEVLFLNGQGDGQLQLLCIPLRAWVGSMEQHPCPLPTHLRPLSHPLAQAHLGVCYASGGRKLGEVEKTPCASSSSVGTQFFQPEH